MAFKRSAVRSRLSPPRVLETERFSGLFLFVIGKFILKKRVLQTAPIQGSLPIQIVLNAS